MSYQKDYSYSSESTAQSVEVTTATAYRDMFGWMACGLSITALTALFVMNRIEHSSAWFEALYGGTAMWILAIASLVLVFALNGAIHKLSFVAATSLFALYSVIMGAWLSPIVYMYTAASVGKVFLITAGTFGGMAVYGHFTKADLSKLGKICIMALWGIIIASLVNFFMRSAAFDYVLSYITIVVFCGLTMYDVQKFKNLIEAYSSYGEGDMVRRIALLGALELYLDFVNLFIRLLSLFGRRK